MFRNRASSQKPGDELYVNFRRQHFPASGGGEPSSVTVRADDQAGGEVLGDLTNPERAHSVHDIKDMDPTPRAQQQDAWRFTPSLLDPNSFAFSAFANQPPGYYTPTPGGTNTIYHSQAGDLHTPGMGMMGMGLGTPLSMPTSDGNVHASAMLDLSSFAPPPMHAQHFQNFNPFGQHPPHTQPPQPSMADGMPQAYAPSSFVHQDTGYETMEQDGSPLDDDDGRMGSIDSSIQTQSPLMGFRPVPSNEFDMNIDPVMPATAEKFRFSATLNAPTAMIKHADEIPVTYLNKGQTYSLSVVDTAAALPLKPGAKYRTFVRVSFDDEQQRQKPATCWQLWKEGRGTNEAHQRGGKLQAVEYVEKSPSPESDDRSTKARLELDTASFDGFSVLWSPESTGAAECNISMRFNFLSTDFSHSKGVKGIPVRLCAKTSIVAGDSPQSTAEQSEVAYCKVKLFRDHGAERKLSNDVAHVKKTIEKLKQQIAQAETGMKDFGKRKRNSLALGVNKAQPIQKPGKVQKHKRTWSMSSASSAGGGGGGRRDHEDDLHFKLQTLQDMFTSTRPVSFLYLRGADLDDPDLNPVALAGEPIDITKADARDLAMWQQRSEQGSATGGPSLVSPSPSSLSLNSQGTQPTIGPSTTQWQQVQPEQSTRVPKVDETGNLSGWIEALGVDPSYRPPAEQPPKPVACFYIQYRDPATPQGQNEYYRAVYLAERTLQDFTTRVALKWKLDPSKIVRTLHVLAGLEVEVDDDVIRELHEGQDMVMEINKVDLASGTLLMKREWEMAVDSSIDAEAGQPSKDITQSTGYEIRLAF